MFRYTENPPYNTGMIRIDYDEATDRIIVMCHEPGHIVKNKTHAITAIFIPKQIWDQTFRFTGTETAL